MKKLSDVPMTPEDFEAWLRTKEPDTIVGVACETEHCPLTTYIRETLEVKEVVYVNNHTYGIRGTNQQENLPDMLTEFVQAIDIRRRPWDSEEVTAARALEVLGQVMVSDEESEDV